MDITPPSTRRARAQAARIAMLERKLKKRQHEAIELAVRLDVARQDIKSLWAEKWKLFDSVDELKVWHREHIFDPHIRCLESHLRIAESAIYEMRKDPHVLFAMFGTRVAQELLAKWEEISGR